MSAIRRLIDANKKALEDRTLGAFKYGHCAYVYDDPVYRCAVGVTLTDEQAASLWGDPFNEDDVRCLDKEGILTGLTSAELRVYEITQGLHDSWAVNGRVVNYFPEHMGKNIHTFITTHESRPCTEQIFREWIALLDKEYPDEDAA